MAYYPNPVTDKLYFQTAEAQENYLKVLNALGQVVHEYTWLSSSAVINTSHWPSGIYTLLLKNEKGQWVEKVLKN